MDNPHRVTDPSTWKRPQYKAEAPRNGVTLDGGLFETVLKHNADYLKDSYTTDDLLRQFYERTGKVKGFKPTGSQIFWEEDLAGSNAGRFLMGAGNTVRWIDDPELRRRLNTVVDGIEECRQPNGYIMAYPEDTIFYSERAAYTRAWLTHGLLEAAYAGNSKALPLLRGYYDWFNQQSFLPDMLRGAIQGGQGMIANTRMSLSPVGKPADAQVIQRYYQEDAWLDGLARREKEQIWQYPYDRPHCYLLTDIEAYLDLYLVTGEKRYFDAAMGAWELYRAHWQHAGGSISIIEFENDPPDSSYLRQKLGELCGSAFWVFLSQRFQLLDPENERYATEIEKSIYNIGIANQDSGTGFRYHTIMEGEKEKSTHENTCCEGQGTRLVGSLPEHVYSIAPDGIYVHLYEPSTVRWKQNGQEMTLICRDALPARQRRGGKGEDRGGNARQDPCAGAFVGKPRDGSLCQWQVGGIGQAGKLFDPRSQLEGWRHHLVHIAGVDPRDALQGRGSDCRQDPVLGGVRADSSCRRGGCKRRPDAPKRSFGGVARGPSRTGCRVAVALQTAWRRGQETDALLPDFE